MGSEVGRRARDHRLAAQGERDPQLGAGHLGLFDGGLEHAGSPLGKQLDLFGPDADEIVSFEPEDARRHDVDARRAEKLGDEPICRPLVDLARRSRLLQLSGAKQGDAIRERHRFRLVVRHVDEGGAQLLVQAPQLCAHLRAQAGIEIRKRLVEQVDAWLAHERPAERDPLPLPARQLPRLARKELGDPEKLRRLGDALVDLGALEAETANLCAKGAQTPGFLGLFNSFRSATPQLYVDVDRVKAKKQGVALNDVFQTLQVYLGSAYVNDITLFNRSWQVNVQADARYRLRPEDVGRLRVRNASGEMVPLETMITVMSLT